MLVKLDKGFPLDRLEQGMRDGLIYKRVELEEGVMYEQLPGCFVIINFISRCLIMHKFVPWLLIGALFCGVVGFTLQLVGLIMMIWG